MIQSFKAVLKKEWLDTIRDRRSVLAAFAYAAFGPLVLYFMITMIVAEASSDTRYTLGLVSPEGSTQLENIIKRQNLELSLIDAFDPANGLPEGINAVLVIPEGFEAMVRDAKIPRLTLYSTAEERRSDLAASRAERAVDMYISFIRGGRLIERGVSPQTLIVTNLERFELSATTDRARDITMMLIMFFILAPFVGGMSVAIDMMAGERERGALQALMAQPLNTLGLISAKWAITSVFAIAATMGTAATGLVVLNLAPFVELGIHVNADLTTFGLLFLILVPFAALVSVAQMAVAIFARNFKEGQTYLSLLSFVPMAIAVQSIIGSGVDERSIWPILSQQAMVREALLLNGFDMSLYLSSLGLTIVAIAALLAFVHRTIGQERMITDA